MYNQGLHPQDDLEDAISFPPKQHLQNWAHTHTHTISETQSSCSQAATTTTTMAGEGGSDALTVFFLVVLLKVLLVALHIASLVEERASWTNY